MHSLRRLIVGALFLQAAIRAPINTGSIKLQTLLLSVCNISKLLTPLPM